MTTMHRPSPGAKGVTANPTPAILAKLDAASLALGLMHPAPKPTRHEACLSAGAQAMVSEVLGFGFEDASVFEHPCGWGVALTYETGVDWTTAGRVFTEGDLRRAIVLGLSGTAALALFRGRDLLAGFPDVIGIACTVQRRAELVGLSFTAALNDALAITARILTTHRTSMEQAAALIERDGAITRDTCGMNTLLAAARAAPIAEMLPALDQATKLARLLGACRMDLGALAREVSQLARESRP